MSLLLLAALFCCGARPARTLAAAPAAAQPPNAAQPAAAGAAAKELPDRRSHEVRNVFPPPDRTRLRLLTQARQLIDRQRHAEAVRCLGAIFDSPQDYFFSPDQGAAGPRSLKSEAQRLLGQMSLPGRQAYELQYGARARHLLQEAVARGDGAGLAEVSRRFFHTRAGYEATLLVGLDHLDHGRPLAGALALERLREASPEADQFEPGLSVALAICRIRAGNPQKAAQTLQTLEQRLPHAAILIAGREVALFGKEVDALELLAELSGPQTTTEAQGAGQWAMFRGNAARNVSTAAHGPLLNRRWRVPSTNEPLVEAVIEHVRRVDEDWDRLALPAFHPLALDDVVLMRTVHSLLAVDFATGKRLWEAPVDNPFEVLLSPDPDLLQRRTSQLRYALRLRLWGDATYGTMSSDGQYVFVVEDLGLEIGPTRYHRVLAAPPHWGEPAGQRTYNRLAAYDVRTGKLQWHLGGSEEEYGLAQAGTFFLGPPLPLMGRLYVLGETMGEIRLMVVEAKSGELIWWQQLAGTDQLLLKDLLRRMAGVSPSYADGILVCPTGNRSIVAVELATRSLLWGFPYARTDGRSQPQLAFFGARAIPDPDPVGRWVDSALVLAEGRVLATPVDSDSLYCLDLAEGRLLWKEPRGDDLYLACVHEGKAILVGERRVRALDLYQTRADSPDEPPKRQSSEEPLGAAPPESGLLRPAVPDDCERPAPAWDGRTVEFPMASRPSGMGFLSGDRYYVPLSTAEVMAVDLSTGRPGQRFKSRRGSVPGNLVCAKGRVLSQGAVGLEAFDQLEPLRLQVDERLAASSDDAEALCLRGEIFWGEGRLQQAIESFRRALSVQSDPDTRQLLREALFEGLRTQFATHRGDVDAIRELIDQPGQQATLLRLMADGLIGAGEFLPALDYYWKLIELDSDQGAMDAVDASHSVRRDRWIQGQLGGLRESCPESVRAEIDRVAAERWEAALAEAKPEPVQRFLQYFGTQPIADEARRHLARLHEQSGELLAAERLWQQEQRQETPQRRGAAIAAWAEMLRRSRRWRDAAVCYAQLGRQMGDVVCRDGKTGRELLEGLSHDDPIRDHLGEEACWPTGEVLVSQKKTTSGRRPAPSFSRAPLGFHGRRGPFYDEMTVELVQSPSPRLVGRNGLGKEVWQLRLTDLASEGDFLLTRGLMRVSACGHLLLLASGQRLLAVDTLGTTADPSARVLWSRELEDPRIDAEAVQLRVQLANLAAGIPQILLARSPQDPANLPVIVNEQILCFKRFRRCVAIDPWTGDTLWVRGDLPRDSDVFGDHRYVFVVPSGETTATVLRAQDGKLLGQREVPLERLTTLGRRVLVWRYDDGHHVLQMVDPWDNRPLWPEQRFAATTSLNQLDQEAVALYEPDGRFVLVDLHDGRRIIDEQLEERRSLSEVLVLASADGYNIVLYDGRSERSRDRQIRKLHGVVSVPIARGQVYAFDREGNRRWPEPVKVEGQVLLQGQPARLPVLTFASMIQQRKSNSGQYETKTSILCIDKRTGREVFGEQFRGATNSFRQVGDPETKTVELGLQQTTVTLTFTDQPPKPKTDEQDASGKSGSTRKWGSGPLGGLWKAIRAAIDGVPSESNEP